MTPAFEKWLREHVTDANRRAALVEAADGLVDLHNAERIDLEDVLTISEWPAFARNRFLRAWQALRDAGRAAALAADEGTEELVLPAGPGNPPTVATRATQTPGGIIAPARRELAALAAPKQRDRSIVGPSLGPRDARGCFPCPAGCPRTFAHAPAAVQHGRSCAAGGARPPGAAAPPETNRDDETAEEAAGAELTEAEVRGALQAAGGRMKTKDLLVRFKARFKANPANKDAIKRPLRAVADVQDSSGVRVLMLKPPETNHDETAEEAAAPPPPPPDTSRDEELARQLSGAGERRRQETQRFADLADTGQSYALPKRAAADESQRPKKKAKSPVAASAESSDAAEARALATDQAEIREAYAREQARATEEAREQARATEEDILRIGNAALTRRLSTEEEIPRGREKKRCAATRAPAETPLTAPRSGDTTDDDWDAEVLPAKRVRGTTPPRPTLQSPTATTASDTVPVTPEVPKKVKVPSKPWDLEETRRFYDALRRFGTDFTMMLTAFPGRTQRQLKNKYKQESRTQSSLVSMALDASIATDLTAPQVAPDDDNMSTGNVNDDEAEFFTCSF